MLLWMSHADRLPSPLLPTGSGLFPIIVSPKVQPPGVQIVTCPFRVLLEEAVKSFFTLHGFVMPRRYDKLGRLVLKVLALLLDMHFCSISGWVLRAFFTFSSDLLDI